jgi:hypothetical protein
MSHQDVKTKAGQEEVTNVFFRTFPLKGGMSTLWFNVARRLSFLPVGSHLGLWCATDLFNFVAYATLVGIVWAGGSLPPTA